MNYYYRKKPVTIQAWQFNAAEQAEGDELTRAYPQWLLDAISSGDITFSDDYGTILHPKHGELRFNDTDWIIFGSETDIYPCADDVFQQVYEAVSPPDNGG